VDPGALTAGNAAAARQAARAILREGRFHPPAVPRPLHGLLHAIGRALQAPLHLLSKAVTALARVVPGGKAVVWILLGLAVIGLAVLLAGRYSRLALIRGSEAPGGRAQRRLRAADLLRAAEAAEREGRLEEALRLRFRAGLASLNERGVIGAPEGIPNLEVARRLHSQRFDSLSRRFEEVAYGSGRAGPADVEEARRGWSTVLAGREPE
jgi:Domain of unknown function (DUF4129)